MICTQAVHLYLIHSLKVNILTEDAYKTNMK